MIKSKIVKILSTAALSIPILFAASALTNSNVSADSNKSPLVDVEIPAHENNHHGKRNHIIDRITVHHANGHLTAENMGDMFAKPETDACSNYGIGYDGEVGLYLTEDYAAGCSYNDFNDHRSINIEVANASDFSAANDYKISDKAYNKLIELCEDICWRHGKDKLLWLGGSYGRTFDESIKSGSRAVGTPTRWANGKIVEWKGAYEPKANEMLLTVHQWFTETKCPGRDLYNKLPGLAEEVTKRLQNRKKQQKQLTTTNTVSTTATQVSTSTAVQQTDEIDYDIMSPYWNEKNVSEEELKEVANKLVKAYECMYGKKSGESYDYIVELATIYAEESRKEGVNPWVAWGQMLLETGGLYFKGDVKYWQNNFCGLKTANGIGYPSFDTFREGIRAHIQHLVAYASTKDLSTPCVDPRFKYVTRGSARTINALTGKWATDPNYGEKLNKLITVLYESTVA